MMRRALELASRGIGNVSPNPMVGAVVTDENGAIIAEGYHRKFGEPHAEVEALRQVAGEDLSKGTLYVSLEPCSHQGKTPPCADLIVESGIGRVVTAMRDPNPLVNGRGNRRLREGGLEVVVGVLENESRKLNEAWIHFIKTGTPFITIKVAQSLDGYIALPDGESQWITGEMARQYVHTLRGASDGILVGTRTALQDDPSLTVRYGLAGRNPRRIVLDRSLELPNNLKLFTDEHKENTTVFIGEDMSEAPRAYELRDAGIGVEAIPVEGNPDNLRLDLVIERLGSMNLTSVLVEGGAAVIDTMIAENLADKLILFIAPKLLGHGIKSFQRLAVDRLDQATVLNIHSTELVGEDIKVEGYLK
ncbi:MAG: bifunctional diaminohydroxyphosphoribosylaminopyrimidine deaminase/5-amino-6-(5-phosphoribosylamino)uracil reductase RibD [Ignavibacteriae bacterium]|nr:bifunctional diaminohydroxyphosphoribosylaminopyrimidine deaminase/5-amino-6-(5-phosphoribosylamino)uracil reductase RibD [Ignavibacteriota bacterium]MCB9217276.1 bifunctional diaminohydroxyphosphoribosylaminopyrimidine deaminase/5-amino-6-(5-phosphoribosylamino)uracil reductase RibD [Ignavibacteria bacterium]